MDQKFESLYRATQEVGLNEGGTPNTWPRPEFVNTIVRRIKSQARPGQEIDTGDVRDAILYYMMDAVMDALDMDRPHAKREKDQMNGMKK